MRYWWLQVRWAATKMLIIVAALAVQDVRERPAESGRSGITLMKSSSERSDFLSYLKLWSWIEEQRETLSNKAGKISAQNFVNPMRVREWREIYRQLRSLSRQLNFSINTKPGNYRQIHEAVVVGSLTKSLSIKSEAISGTAQFTVVFLSGLKPSLNGWLQRKWSRHGDFARCVAGIEAKWVRPTRGI